MSSSAWVRSSVEGRPSEFGSLVRRGVVAIGVAMVIGGCVSPEPEPLDDARLAAEVSARGDAADVMARGLEFSALGPLPIPVPKIASGTPDWDAPDFWHASALAFDPATRAARREVLALRAEAESAGAPDSIGLASEGRATGGAEREGEVNATFDLLGILGVGRSAAARGLADAESRAAFGAFERAVVTAHYEVDRARVRIAANRARVQAIKALLNDAGADRLRIDLLAERGRIGRSEAAWSEAIVHMLEHKATDASVKDAETTAALAMLTGCPPDHVGFAAISSAALDRCDLPAQIPPEPTLPELLAGLPVLREKRLQYAVAEARLRAAVAAQWPTVRLGPKGVLKPDAWITGGVLDFDIPWPGSADGGIRAALERRTAAREAAEDALLAAWTTLRERRTLLGLRLAAIRHAAPTDAASEAMWRAAVARFRADAAMIEGWSFGLEHRVDPLLAHIDAREAAALAAIDYDEASARGLTHVQDRSGPVLALHATPESRRTP